MTAPSHPHAITIERNPNRVQVTFNGTVIADTRRALVLREGPLPPAQYIPREDVTMDFLRPTTHSTHCPFKGDASYFTVSVDGKTAENAVWTYETPLLGRGRYQEICGLLSRQDGCHSGTSSRFMMCIRLITFHDHWPTTNSKASCDPPLRCGGGFHQKKDYFLLAFPLG